MPSPEPSLREAILDAVPGLLLSTGMFAAATQAIQVARASAQVKPPMVVDFSIVRDAVHSPTAWLIVCVCSAAIAYGIERRSHAAPAIGQLLCTAIVYFRVMGTWLEPVTGIVDFRTVSAILWLYMPQSLAMACFGAHIAIAYRRSR